MPRIPGFQESTQLQPSTPVEIASTGDARTEGRALAGIGEAMMTFGRAFRDARNQVEKTKARNEMAEIYAGAREEALRKGKPDGSDYLDLYNQTVSKQIPKILSRYSDPGLVRDLEIESSNQNRAQRIGIMEDTTRAQQTWLVDQNKEIIDGYAKKAFSSPDTAALDYLDFRDNHLKPLVAKGTFSPATADAMDKIARAKIADSYFEGLMAQKKFGQAAKLLNAQEQDVTLELKADELGAYGLKADGSMKVSMIDAKGAEIGPEVSELVRSLTPDQRERYLGKLRAEAEKATQIRIRTVNDNVNAYVNFSLQGAAIPRESANSVREMVRRLPPDIRAQYEARLATADKLAPVIQTAASGSPAEVQAAFAKFEQSLGKPQDLAAQYEVEQLRSKALSAIQDIQEKRLKDPVAMAVSTDSDTLTFKKAAQDGDPGATASYIQRLQEVQRRQGVPEHRLRVLSNSEAVGLAERLRAAQTADVSVMAAEIDRLDKQYGPHLDKVMIEIASQDKAVNPAIIVAAQVPNASSKRDILENIQKKKVIDEAFNALPKDARDGLDEAVTAQMDRFQGALMANARGTEALSTTAAFREQVETQARKNMALRGMDQEDAVEHAYKSIVENNFDFVDTSRSQIIMPRKAAYNPRLVERFTDDFAPSIGNRTAMTQLGIEPTEAYYARVEAQFPGRSRQELKDAYIQNVLANGRWVTNETQTGIRLVVDSARGRSVVVRGNGSPVEFSFYDLGNYTNPREFSGLRK